MPRHWNLVAQPSANVIRFSAADQPLCRGALWPGLAGQSQYNLAHKPKTSVHPQRIPH